TERSIVADTSPVKAPSSSKCRFCAPSPTGEPRSTSETLCRLTKGGQTATRTPFGSPTASTTPRASCLAVMRSVFIFQFPATNMVSAVDRLGKGRVVGFSGRRRRLAQDRHEVVLEPRQRAADVLAHDAAVAVDEHAGGQDADVVGAGDV